MTFIKFQGDIDLFLSRGGGKWLKGDLFWGEMVKFGINTGLFWSEGVSGGAKHVDMWLIMNL